MASQYQHFRALMNKNYIGWKRSCCASCSEIMIPFVFMLLLFWIRSAISQNHISEKIFTEASIQIFPDLDPSNTRTLTTDQLSKYATSYGSDNIVNSNQTFPYIKNCKTNKANNKLARNGDVALAAHDITAPIVVSLNNILTSMGYVVRTYDSIEAMQSYVSGSSYQEDLCFGISFQEIGVNNVYKYSLSYNTSGQENHEIPDTLDPHENQYLENPVTDDLLNYVSSGYVQVQNFIDNLILKELTGQPTAQITVDVGSVRIAAHTYDLVTQILQGNFATYVVLPMIVIYLSLVRGVLKEKESKAREGMKIMGMTNSSYYWSWIALYLIITFCVSFICVLVMKASVFKHSDFVLMLIWHWLFTISVIFQALFITVFFSNARLGNIVAMVFYVAMIAVVFIFSGKQLSSAQKGLSALISQNSVSYGCDTFLTPEAYQKGINWADIATEYNNISIITCMFTCIANIIIFALLFVYLDQVFPNEFGQKKHPLFCLMRKKKAVERLLQDEEDIDINRVEPVDAMLKSQESENKTLMIKGLSKTYSNGKIAVKNLNLTMYKDQIFCLLGHNGAGKTSTISMLTGLQEITQGDVTAFGYNVATQLDELRQIIGVCPQHDILFESLTVKEHLELFAAFKGLPQDEVNAAVDQMIKDVDLEEKRDVLSKDLSGGQKRRLSVAIAFIGGSKLIYLDEPTSGMDPSARRYIWEMMKKYKNDKIIVLTTHFMDEADFLGDRIGIMGNGKLICCGSSIFLKNQFGVGYNLTVVKTNPIIDGSAIEKLVKGRIPEAKKLSDVSAEMVFQLPMSTIKDFESLFETLDTQKDQLNVQTYGISITTMEEVFLRVAHLGDDTMNASLVRKMSESKDPVAAEQKYVDDFDLNSERIQGKFRIFWTHFLALFLKRIWYFKRDKKGLMCEVLLPMAIIVVGLAVMLIQFFVPSPYELTSPSLINPVVNVVYSGAAAQSDMDGIMSKFDTTYWKPVSYAAATIDQWDEYNYNNSQAGSIDKGQYWFNSLDKLNNKYEYTAFVNSEWRAALPVFMNTMNQQIIRQATGKDIEIQVVNAPFKFTKRFLGVTGSATGFVAALMFSMAVAFIPAGLVSYIVKEREELVKHQHMVSGVSLFSYWISNFVMDMTKHLFPAIFGILMVLAYDISSLSSTSDRLGAICGLFILYGWAIIPFTYLTGFLFKNYGASMTTTFFINFLIGALGSILVFILRLISSTRSVGLDIQWILRLFPCFSFAYGVLNIGSIDTYSLMDGRSPNDPYSAYAMNIAGGDLLMLGITGAAYFILIFVVEYVQSHGSLFKCFSSEDSVPYVPKKYDSDVINEFKEIQNSKPGDYSIRVKDLRKVYTTEGNVHKVAVDRVSFGIKNGECFTLLGVNGAGKTTTFKILTGEILQTSGESSIMGFDTQSDLASARQYIGYCPQFDALVENLTAREHLYLYAAIKGIPRERRDKMIQNKLEEMDLLKFEGIVAGTFSGGNKRKLSVAIAMLGNPPIVFLDEPSTGMDPEARRFMWNVISRISTQRKQSSIILTTHSMEEAEALSTKMAIQVSGELKCIGSIQHLKSKFSEGYEVEIKTNTPTPNEIEEFLKNSNLALATSAKVSYKTNSFIKRDQLPEIGRNLQITEYINEIKPDGVGSQLYQQIISQQGLAFSHLIEFVIVEKLGQQIKQFIGQNLGEYTVIEHFQTFYRFKIKTNVSIGKVFGIFEKSKLQLNISQYSVKQATIEQIFNLFAEGKIDESQYRFISDEPIKSNPLQRPNSAARLLEMERMRVSPNSSDKEVPAHKQPNVTRKV